MAKQNEVYLYGMVMMDPRISKNEDGTYLRGTVPILVVRGQREIGNNDLMHIRYDSPIILSGNPDIISIMSQVKQYDMVEIKGVYTTKNITKSKMCECGGKASKRGTMSYISPIYMDIREHCESEIEARALLKKRNEISNTVSVIGNVTSEPKYNKGTGAAVLQYTIAVNRKFFLQEDKSLSKTDYPIIKTFGKGAERDYKRIQKTTKLLINGMLQTEEFQQKLECPCCNKEVEFTDTAMEIIPYSVEYLDNFLTEGREETESEKEMKKEAAEKAAAKIFGS